jgi:BlaI family transcriptional regulator, penicillinase repressor
MNKVSYLQLSRRERQVMDVLYQREKASATEIQAHMPDAPGYSAVRALLRVLEEKGCIRHVPEGLHYVYLPVLPRDDEKQSTLKHVIRTFFGGSAEAAVATLVSGSELSKTELDRLARLIDKARGASKTRRGRSPQGEEL